MRNLFKRAYKAITALVLVVTMLFSAGIFTPAETEANDIGIPVTYLMDHPRGEINTYGGSVYGYTTDYMKGGPMEIQWHVGNGWHIYATMSYYVYGITWYYCIDSDDGDVYGWIDGDYIDFYDNSVNAITSVYSIDPRRGEIDGNGIYGYTWNYVVYGGAQQTEHKVQDTWHITAYSTCYSHGVTWYECWDTDDGDYYGWIDANYLSFYDELPPPTEAPTPPPTEATTKATTTEAATEAAAVTEATTVTTEPVTVPAVVMTTVTAASEASGTGISMVVIIAIIAVIILLLIIIAVLLIILLVKRSKPAENAGMQPAPQPAPVFCQNCGAEKTNQGGIYCENCGKPYDAR